MTIILIDMDGTLADFEQGVLDVLTQHHPTITPIPLERRSGFRIKDQYPPIVRPVIADIYNADGFALHLKPINGALEAIIEMLSLGLEPFICTSPLSGSLTNASDKINWIKLYFNSELARRVIITKDKTLVRGDFLIDDCPQITGLLQPTWRHLLFDSPSNNDFWGRKITWQNWKDFVLSS